MPKQLAVGCAFALGGWLVVGAGISWCLQTRYGAPAVDTLGVSAMAGLIG